VLFEWILVVAPVAFSAAVFGLALGTDPIDLALQEMTIPSSLVERGFTSDAIDDSLKHRIDAIVDSSGSDRVTGKIEIGTADTAVNAYAEMSNLEVPVRATQRLLGMVEYVAETYFVVAGDNDIVAEMHVRRSNILETAYFAEYKFPPTKFDKLLDDMALDIVGFLDPYIRVLYLYNDSIKDPPNVRYEEVIEQIRKAIPVADPALIPWFYDVLGQISEKLNDPDLAIEYYKSAVEFDPNFQFAHVNWGRLLFRQGKTLDAIEHYVAALEIGPSVASTYTSLARALIAQDQFRDAFLALARAERLSPEFAGVYVIRAELFERLGLPELARQQQARAEIAREREPNQRPWDTL
jgi:tetratricopeptide (TPR) repeat protein